jgi:hypothetical protein
MKKDKIKFYYMMLRKHGVDKKDAAQTARAYVDGRIGLQTFNAVMSAA